MYHVFKYLNTPVVRIALIILKNNKCYSIFIIVNEYKKREINWSISIINIGDLEVLEIDFESPAMSKVLQLMTSCIIG